jgi:hypothetical protein
MDMNKNFNKWIRVTTICCFALWFSGCASLTKRSAAPNPPNDSPLPQFILGAWESIDVQSSESVSSDIRYAITFDRELLVNIIVIYPSGSTEGYTFGYEFIDHDTIHVNNIRTTGGENWHLERDNGNLIVTQYLNNLVQIIVLVRVE